MAPVVLERFVVGRVDGALILVAPKEAWRKTGGPAGLGRWPGHINLHTPEAANSPHTSSFDEAAARSEVAKNRAIQGDTRIRCHFAHTLDRSCPDETVQIGAQATPLVVRMHRDACEEFPQCIGVEGGKGDVLPIWRHDDPRILLEIGRFQVGAYILNGRIWLTQSGHVHRASEAGQFPDVVGQGWAS